jgi:hypothetical protein
MQESGQILDYARVPGRRGLPLTCEGQLDKSWPDAPGVFSTPGSRALSMAVAELIKTGSMAHFYKYVRALPRAGPC